MPIKPQKPSETYARYDRVYDLYRNCVLNELYYGQRLKMFSRIGLWLEITIVVGSGVSGVSGWVIWTKYPQISFVWGIIAAASVLLAALKPALKIDTHLKRYSTLFSAYRQLALSMQMAAEEIAEHGEIRIGTEREIERIRSRYRTLAIDDDPSPTKQRVVEIQGEVNKRIPPESLFYPLGVQEAPRSQDNVASIAGDADGVDVKINPAETWPDGRERRM